MDKHSILIIEDDADVRHMLAGALAEAGYAVHQAVNGRDGLHLASVRSPVLILLDLGLPDIDGGALIAQLRKVSAAPIVVVSARHHEAEKVAALDNGADDYLSKPFGVPELLARVRAHIRRVQPDGPAPFSGPVAFGDVRVDLAARVVTRAGQIVHLTPTEFKLLATLIGNADRVMTHAELLKQTWGAAYHGRAHYVRLHMAHLRQKLEVSPTQPAHFITETGVGYRFSMAGQRGGTVP